MEMTLNVSEDFISQLLKEGDKEGITINVIEQKVQSKDNLLTASKLKKELRIGDDFLKELLAEGLPVYERTKRNYWFYYPEVIEWIRTNRRI